ncbi:MAG: hypothetical protein OEV37_00140 [Candidatus Berkelbacteria bacterium]|nr:hypothetical protein [Candidatus Berkelbacteria bacterium]
MEETKKNNAQDLTPVGEIKTGAKIPVESKPQAPSAAAPPAANATGAKARIGSSQMPPAPAKVTPTVLGRPAPQGPPAQVPPPPPGGKAVIGRPGTGPKIFKIIGIVALILAAAAAVFFFFFYRAVVDINPTPAPDKILLDGKEIKAGIYRLWPGKHKISIEKQGYVSYELEKDFSIAEKQELNFKLEGEKETSLIASGAKKIRSTKDEKIFYFLSSEGRISAFIKTAPDKAIIEERSNASYQGVKEYLVSDNGNFALILDAQALRVLDFTRVDFVNQVEAVLPPLATSVGSISWNSGSSRYFTEANSRIVYDLKTTSGWDLITADIRHSKANIVMQFKEGDFSSLNLDWSESQKNILLVGGRLCVLDIVTRPECSKPSDKTDFIWGKWGPAGKYAILVDKNQNAYALKGDKVEDLKVKTAANLAFWESESKVILLSSSKPVRIDFDTGEVINYAEIKGTKGANSFAVLDGKAYFTDNEGLKEAILVSSGEVYQ